MTTRRDERESSAECVKRQSRGLRGTIGAELGSERDSFDEADKLVLKFHGIYQQDDRDARSGRDAGEGKSYSFMVRVAAPGGALTAAQYLELDRLAGEFGNGTLRLTTRQGVQFHGVIKRDLRSTVRGNQPRAAHHSGGLRRRAAQRHGLPGAARRRAHTARSRPWRRASRATSRLRRARTTRSGSTARSTTRFPERALSGPPSEASHRRLSVSNPLTPASMGTITCRASSRSPWPSTPTTASTSSPTTAA